MIGFTTRRLEYEQVKRKMYAIKIVLADTKKASFDEIWDALREVVDIVEILRIPANGKQAVAEALAYAIRSTVTGQAELNYKDETEKLDFSVIERLIVSEFWHSLNRKGLVKNDEVGACIVATYDRMVIDGTYYLVTPRGLMRSDDGVNWKLWTDEDVPA